MTDFTALDNCILHWLSMGPLTRSYLLELCKVHLIDIEKDAFEEYGIMRSREHTLDQRLAHLRKTNAIYSNHQRPALWYLKPKNTDNIADEGE